MIINKVLVKLYINKVHIVQPCTRIRKLDHRVVFYKFGNTLSPIPPSSFRGYLRHLARIVVSHTGNKYLNAYLSLFGSDIREYDPNIHLVSKEGKLIVSLSQGLNESDFKVGIRPGIRVNRTTGTTAKEALFFSEYVEIISKKPIVFNLEFKEPLSKEEEVLLAATLNLMKNGGTLGGWISKGMGLIRRIEVEPKDFLKKSLKLGGVLG
ncbi:MAG: hypothetical protein DRO40_07080 [Thermoprotei archaeon]|nr:MAG: hypothetical protein DRO40_07080 [Thermoprotei archaeon]